MGFLKTILQQRENLIALKKNVDKLITSFDDIIMLNTATSEIQSIDLNEFSETKTLSDLILNIIDIENRFLLNREILYILTIDQADHGFNFEITPRTISAALSKLQKRYSICLYKHNGVKNMALWGNCSWLDKNRIPKEKYITNSVWKQRIANFKIEHNLK
jgi:hypothetical protein